MKQVIYKFNTPEELENFLSTTQYKVLSTLENSVIVDKDINVIRYCKYSSALVNQGIYGCSNPDTDLVDLSNCCTGCPHKEEVILETTTTGTSSK